MQTLEQARVQYRNRSVKWGFIWALWCAILWGAWYVPGTAVWYEAPFVDMAFETPGETLLAAAIITTLNAVAVLLFLFIWVGTLGKLSDYGRTIRQMKKISFWYFFAAIFGGPCAIYGSYLAIAYVGPVFAAIAALLYPVVGATIARLWYNEKITTRAALGIFIIISGGVVVYGPGIFGEMSGASDASWIGYLGGAMAALGWGIEGAIAGRALDVTDPDVGITVRFTAETAYWVFIILPLVALFSDAPVWSLVGRTLTSMGVVWLLLAGITFAFCYVSWYKSFPLIGVGRGQAIADLYGVFAVLWLLIFTLDVPQWNFVIGLLLTIFGGFVMYTEKSEVIEVVRAVGKGDETAEAC